MRSGVIISIVSHIMLVALALFGTPKLFDAPAITSIEVDLVRPEEIEHPKENARDNMAAEWNPLPEAKSGQQRQAKSQPQPTPWIFDPVNIPALLDLPNALDKGFDAEATIKANLSASERAAFKTHLKKCWILPAGMSSAQSTRVVLRVYLRRDGGLAGEPVLIEASASRDGPLLMQAAIRTLKDCQPYGFLPAEKYREWRVLDLGFSPREMAGG